MEFVCACVYEGTRPHFSPVLPIAAGICRNSQRLYPLL